MIKVALICSFALGALGLSACASTADSSPQKIMAGKLISVDTVSGWTDHGMTEVRYQVSTVSNETETVKFFGDCNGIKTDSEVLLVLRPAEGPADEEIAEQIKDKAQWTLQSCKLDYEINAVGT